MSESKNRPTKKQKELLDFIEGFVSSKDYGPSYREIMQGCDYSSVATVALHVNNLIAKGYLRKNGRSARSLEVIGASLELKKSAPSTGVSGEKWLIDKIDERFAQAESQAGPSQSQISSLQVLIGSLEILGLTESSRSFLNRLNKLKSKKQS